MESQHQPLSPYEKHLWQTLLGFGDNQEGLGGILMLVSADPLWVDGKSGVPDTFEASHLVFK